MTRRADRQRRTECQERQRYSMLSEAHDACQEGERPRWCKTAQGYAPHWHCVPIASLELAEAFIIAAEERGA